MGRKSEKEERGKRRIAAGIAHGLGHYPVNIIETGTVLGEVIQLLLLPLSGEGFFLVQAGSG